MSFSIAKREIGNGTLDICIPSDYISVGQPTDVYIRFAGKDVEREISQVDLVLKTLYRTEAGYRIETIESYRLAENLAIDSKLFVMETTTISVPYETPGTLGRIDVIGAFEVVTDRRVHVFETYLNVKPVPHLFSVFFVMLDLGFGLVDIDCVENSFPAGCDHVTKFEYESLNGPFKNSVDAVELFVHQGPRELMLFVVSDQTTGDPVNESGTTYHRAIIEYADREGIQNQIEEILEEAIDS